MAGPATLAEDIDRFAPVMLRLGVVPGPPADPPVPGRAYPLAVDVHDRLGAVSFAVLGLRPDLEEGWWSVTRQYALRGGSWQATGGRHEVPTSPRPFEPPEASERSPVAWVDRPSDGGHGEWDEDPRRRHVLAGIATTATARLAVTDESGATRGIAITSWCGAYVAVVAGRTSRLTGYGASGEELGSLDAPSTGG